MLVGEPDEVLPVVGPRQVGHMGGARVGITLGFVPGNGELYHICISAINIYIVNI